MAGYNIDIDIDSNNINIDIVKLPEITDLSNWKNLTNIAKPNIPYTIEGTPARLAILISTNLVILFFLLYSSKYMADKTHMGTEIKVTNVNIHILPDKADLIPALCGNRDGKLLRKSNDNLLIPVIDT